MTATEAQLIDLPVAQPDTVLVCSAAGPDVIADDDLSAGQLAEPAITGIVFVEIGVDGISGPRSPMACADLGPGTRDSIARSPCG